MKFKLNKSLTKFILVESSKEEYNQLKLYLNRYVKNYRFMPIYKLGVWDGKVDFFNNGEINFGLWYEIVKCCKEYGYSFVVENKDDFPKNRDIEINNVVDFCGEFYKDHKQKDSEKPFYPYDHQIESIYKLLIWKYGLIEVATAGGKSLIFATLMFYYLKNINKDAKFLLIVPTINLVTQFYNDIMEYNLGFNKDNKTPMDIRIEEIMSQEPRKCFGDEKPNVFIGTYQSLEKRDKKWLSQFDVVCTDEAHVAKSKTINTILGKTFGTANYRFGMSGTYPTNKSAELFTIEALMGPILFLIGVKTLIKKGLISNVKIKPLIINYEDKKFAENVFMIKKNGGGGKAWLLEKDYTHKSLKRKQFISKLIGKFKNNSLVLFINVDFGKEMYDYFRDNIEGIDFYHIDGKTTVKKRDYIKEKMEKTKNTVEYIVLDFGDYEIEVKSDFKILLSDGKYKKAKDITNKDDIDDIFIKKLNNYQLGLK